MHCRLCKCKYFIPNNWIRIVCKKCCHEVSSHAVISGRPPFKVHISQSKTPIGQ